jgi:hypothetical protein
VSGGEAFVAITVLWVVLGLIRRSGTTRPSTGPERRPGPGPLPRQPVSMPRRRAPLEDASRREGFQLEALLRGLQVRLEQSGARPRPPEEAVPAEVDLDDEGARAAARRIAEAEARSQALSDADHQKFEQQIRQQPADHTAVARPKRPSLRDAVVWSEILGRPKGE